MRITTEVTWFWARSCDSGFLILEKAGGSFASSCGTGFPEPQATCQLLDHRGSSSITGSPDLLWCLGSNPAQSRSHALTLIHPCNQSFCWTSGRVLSSEPGTQTSWPTRVSQSFPLLELSLHPGYSFVSQAFILWRPLRAEDMPSSR